ncbi:MAG: LysR family transcriptional regulator [Lawsonibacter sp.]|nr:LysR family transcriptional regulator [Lawsonibacter sp.]
MDYEDAKIYLELYRSRSITKTAQLVGLTQSAISQRLQKLEREFGMQLMLRGRGQKFLEPTRHGERLVPIVQQWINLYESAHSVKNNTARVLLNVASTDSIGVYLLPNFFFQYAQNHKDVSLSIHTNHSWEIFDLLDDGTVDVGLTNRESVLFRDDLILKPVYQERFVLLTSPQNRAEYTSSLVHPETLDITRELYFDITPSFAQWRESLWGDKRPFLQVSFAQILPPMLVNSPYWSILPLSIARFFLAHYPLEYYELAEPPEPRVCSIVTHQRYRTYKAEQKETFIHTLTAFFQSLMDLE